jgi:hypothetical protein
MHKVFSFAKLYSYHDHKYKLLPYLSNNKSIAEIFKEYFKGIDVHSFLIEDNYVDKDFLIDYSNYYSRCHKPYERFGLRIHFFLEKNEKFTLTDTFFRGVLKNRILLQDTKEIQNLYLGFVVLRPFKNDSFLIGKTCLKHYPENDERYYTAKRSYNVNLFGIDLSVETMAFQEQDQSTAVCATIALWSAFNITGVRFQHPILSPSEITKLALSESSYKRQNEGLSVEQISVGISRVGLTPIIDLIDNNRDLKMVTYAYLKAKLPVIYALWLFNQNDDGSVDEKSITYHAVTVNGFSLKRGIKDAKPKDETRFYSNRISKVYGHDDQLCPFARMEITSYYRQLKSKKTDFQIIKTSWDDKAGKQKIAKIQSIVVPLNSKIRVSHKEILKEITSFSIALDEYILGMDADQINLEWDFFLSDVNSFKSDLLQSKKLINRKLLLTDSYSKYVWRARAIFKNACIFEIVFDATDSPKRGVSRNYIFYDQKYIPIIETVDAKIKIKI